MAANRTHDRKSQVQRPNHYTTNHPSSSEYIKNFYVPVCCSVSPADADFNCMSSSLALAAAETDESMKKPVFILLASTVSSTQATASELISTRLPALLTSMTSCKQTYISAATTNKLRCCTKTVYCSLTTEMFLC